MRVMFCKLHCPSFICFCKPSSHLLSPCPLKLENTPNVTSNVPSVTDVVDHLSPEKDEVEKVSIDGKQEVEIVPKSSLKKSSSQLGKEVEKGKVQWMDFFGKELVEIREFEASESEESEDEGDGVRGCFCVIQ
ncbi:nuclear polyadenylated RNA-binding protein [Thalictrum thalictroides]|uniref:Nuclear polyadenylated RNA-binding protein n=1 Tax=Thalictrum thalictroides TaxID=46969 RepID=A0A7J6W7S8_THATH|nr:nuclear polyadenylated RNA-binding protein [Thalictrum thalictroides]